MTDVTRRGYLGGVAAAAVARWEDEEYDLENVEEWDPMDTHSFTTGEFTPEAAGTNGEAPYSGWMVEDDVLNERKATVFYDADGVTVSIGGDSDDGMWFGSHVEFTPADAKEYAAAVFQAAEELERRREVENGDN